MQDRKPFFSELALGLALFSCSATSSCSCGNSEEPGAGPPASKGADAPDAAEEERSAGVSRTREGKSSAVESLAGEPFSSDTLGAVHGEVRFLGTPPERFQIVASEKPECSHFPEEVEHLSEVVIVNDGKLESVLVYLSKGVDASKVPAPPSAPATLDQRGCTYRPHVLALQAGRKLLVANSDPTNHNVHVVARKNTPSNRNVGEGQPPLELLFDKEELSLRFKCDIHPWMGAWLHVIEHPWFAITDDRGSFRIEDVPPGTYTVEFLHEEYGRLSAREIAVEPGRSTGIAVSFD